MNKFFTVVAIICLMCGCSDSGQEAQEQSCAGLPVCEGDSKLVCQDDKPVTVPCGEGQTCLQGACVPDVRCDDGLASYCQGNQAISCVNGLLHDENCEFGCRDGGCLEPSCTSDGSYPYCDEAGQVVTCQDGEIKRELCRDNQVCVQGECVGVAASCGNGMQDEGEACDDGVDNGKYGKCRLDCLSISQCGDGILDAPDEVCDDGADNGKYGKCRLDCLSVSQCGDGVVDASDEVCDDGADNGKPGKCHLDCQSQQLCGNGIVDPGETCDPPSTGMIVSCHADCTRPQMLFEEYPTAENISTEVPETCDVHDLWQKYLVYRERFIGNAQKHIPGFISWGMEPGQSLPAEYRDPTTNCATVWRYSMEGSDCDFEDLADAQGSYGWGDTSLWLGIMAHWLALEYYVYKQYGLDTTETEKYIYLTLKAFERLDLAAETYFGLEGKLDGFFIRDDIPRLFFKEGENYRFSRTDAFLGYECAVSGTACKLNSGATGKDLLQGGAFVSQDQLTGLYEGFGMIARFVDEHVEYEGYGLRHGARAAIDLMIRNLRDHNWMLGIQTSDGWLQVPGEWGGYTQLMSSLFAESSTVIAAPDFGLDSYHDDATNTIKSLIPSLIATIWPLWEYENNYNRNLILRLMNYTEFWDDAKLTQMSLESGREYWPLSHALYWDRPLPDDYPLWRMHAILSTAPCEGPCHGDTCINPTPGWMGDSYFASPNFRIGFAHTSGDYNGLDYLIGYPLYLLAYAQKTGRGYTHKMPEFDTTGHLLQDWMNGSKPPSEYRVSENIGDMQLMFCGRPFADWIRDNALGLSDIYIQNMRWQCQLNGVCQISKDNNPYMHTHALIIGTDGNDIFDIPKGYHHCIAGMGGDDTITAAEGLHFIEGGSGKDTIQTSGPHVTIYGGDGDDKIYPGSGYHLVDAGSGNDWVDSSSYQGTYLFFGGDGHDTLRVGGGSHTLVGGPGNDILEGGSGDNSVWGNAGHDKIQMGGGDNIIYPGDGHAFIHVGNGDNSIQTVSPQNDNVYICFGTGKNSVYAGWSSTSYCSAVQNSDIHQYSCRPTLTAEDCTQSAYENWNF